MKRILSILYSSRTTIILLVILVIAMGTGTFIEDKYDTVTARSLIYNAKWFELLFLLLALNFIGHIKSFHMLRKQRMGGVIFHMAFIVMILGAGVTRYFGYEGHMHIREGEASNIMYSAEPYLRISLPGNSNSYQKDFEVNFSEFADNKFHIEIPSTEKGKIEINCNEFIKNAVEKFDENIKGGTDLLEIVVAAESGRERVVVEKGETKRIGKMHLSFNSEKVKDGLAVTEVDGQLQITSPYEMTRTGMAGMASDTIKSHSTAAFIEMHVYNTNDVTFMFKKFYKSAVKKLVKSDGDETGYDALIFDVKVKDQIYKAPLLFASGQAAEYQEFDLEGQPLSIAYGRKPLELPFSIHLNDFILERYPGSESPSSYASEVTVIDNKNNIKKDYRIYMNHILDFDNYRFFQSSYDQDEKGTILSVNHDFWGTWISYLGYFLLAAGFIITLTNRDSRFISLRRIIIELRKMRKAAGFTAAIILGLTFNAFSKGENPVPVDAGQADKFGHLISQSADGRFEPVNSLVYDVLHKITRKDKFNIEGKEELKPTQIFLDMMTDPEFWKQQKIIYIKEQSVRDFIGITTNTASFFDFFDSESKYKLQAKAEEAFRKKPADQNNFDKEIVRVDERVNVFMMVFQGSILKIFPEPGMPHSKWISWDEPSSKRPLSGVVKVINEDLKLQTINYAGIMQSYMLRLIEAKKTGDYSKADRALGYISGIQRQGAATNMLPSESKVNAEIFYNEAQIFIVLKNFYSVLSLLLLLFAFIDNVRSKKSKIIGLSLNFCIGLLFLGFLYQTFGMILRWYLLGYAPWSNGYEALILISWGTLLAGFTFARYSKITTAATALLAFFILMTASHSSYDPQLTNLTPVLKSYWLIIHVAVLTISYGFLGLGFFLGIINLFIYLFKTKMNRERLDLLIQELTFINEMNLTIGIVLATIGTFLGGVWANESWGRYWGWDAKETWALVIVITYTILLHIRFIPKLNGKYAFNVGSVISFGSVLMTFFGVNYFLSKGMHSYGAGDHAIFPIWAWIAILSLILLMIGAYIKEKMINRIS